MDNIDNKIIQILEKNSRYPFLKIAKELDVTETTIRNRVSKLISNGIIKRFTIHHTKSFSAMFSIIINSNLNVNDIIINLNKLNIESIYHLAGDLDLVCFIREQSQSDIERLMYDIKKIKGIGDIKVYPILKEA
jgi:DNA-binding Lrp family transcriptional regulator